MNSKVRNFFKEKMQWLESIKAKKKQDEADKERKKESDRESIVKIIIFSPIIILGSIKTRIDQLNNNKPASKTPDLKKSFDSTAKVIANNKQKENLHINQNNKLAHTNTEKEVIGISSQDKHSKAINNNIDENNKPIKINNSISNNLEQKIINPNENNTKENRDRISIHKSLFQPDNDKHLNSQSIKKGNSFNFDYQKKDTYQLENKILAKLKKSLKSERNKLDTIESELYLINKYSDDENLLEKAQKIQKQIETLLERINKINEEYKLLKNHNVIEEPLLLDDSLLIDNIISYREQISKLDQNKFPAKYQLLEDYIYLYSNLEKIKNENKHLLEESQKRSSELEIRDKKFAEAKRKVVSVEEISNSCNKLINEQNAYLSSLNAKITKINENIIKKTRFKGFNQLLTTSVKYIGLLALTPLRGLIPSIGVRTIMTRKLIGNLAKNMGYEEITSIVYSAVDYESEINNNLYNLNNISNNINETLYDISTLKQKFKNEFSRANLSDYEKTYKKIEILEEQVLDNKERIAFIESQLIKNKKINKDKLVKVKKMNHS